MPFLSKDNSFLLGLTVAPLLLTLSAFNDAATGQTKQTPVAKGNAQGREATSKPGQPKIPSLDQMLKIALKHNPDIRAAEAKWKLAEAELDRTRQEVVKALSTYRTRWRFAAIALNQAKLEVAKAEDVNRRQPGAIPATEIRSLAFQIEKAKAILLRIETELPFLLGKTPGNVAKRPVQEPGQAAAAQVKARAIAEQIVKIKLTSYQVGQRGNVAEIVRWARRVVEADLDLAKSRADRIAAIDEHRGRLTTLKKVSEARFQAGQTSREDVLVVTYHLLQADRMMQRTKSDDSTKN